MEGPAACPDSVCLTLRVQQGASGSVSKNLARLALPLGTPLTPAFQLRSPQQESNPEVRHQT